jgi:tetratricopeptide (TPR) repeat protein
MLQQAAEVSPGDVRIRLGRIDCQRQLGWLLTLRGNRKEAEVIQRQAVREAERLAAEHPRYRHELALCCTNLAATVYLSRPDECAELCRRAIEITEGERGFRAAHAQSYYCQAQLLQQYGDSRAAQLSFRKALATYDALMREEPNVRGHQLPRAMTMSSLASSLSANGQHSEAERLYREAIAVADNLAAESPSVPHYTDSLTSWRLGRAGVLRSMRRFEEAESEYRAVIALLESLTQDYPGALELRDKVPLGEQPWDALLVAARELPGSLVRKADPLPRPRAEPDCVNLTHHGRCAQAYQELACLLVAIGRTAEAEALFKSAVGVFEKLETQLAGQAEHQLSLAHTLACGALRLQSLGRYAEAAQVCRMARLQFTKFVENDPTNRNFAEWLAGEHFRLGRIQALAGQYDESEKAYRQAEEQYAKLAREGLDRHDFLFAQASTRHNIGIQLARRQRGDEAAGWFRESLELYGQLPDEFRERPGYRRNVAVTSNNLAWLLATTSDPKRRDSAGAVKLAKRAVELSPDTGPYWNTLGIAHYRAGDWNESLAAVEKSMALRKGGDAHDWFLMAMIQTRRNEKTKAREWYDKAVTWTEKHEPKNEELARFRAESAELLGIADSK